MVELGNPITPLSSKELQDTIDLSKLDINKRMEWNKKVEAHMRKQTDQGKPFCHHCAIKTYDDYKTMLQKKTQTKLQMGQMPELNPEFKCDMSQFSKSMKFVNETVKNDRRIVAGTPVHVPVYYRNYRCEVCGGGHSLEFEKSMEKSK